VLATGFLFKKDKKGQSSRRAKISRDILRFSLDIEEDVKFSEKELSDWLASNCNAFEFEPGTPTKNKSFKVLSEIGPSLGPLVEIGLIYQIGSEPEKNGTGQFAVYKYSTAGRLLALIIDSIDPEHRIQANHKIYEILQLHYSSNKSSKHQFFLKLLTIYHKQDRLDDLTGIIRKALQKVDYVPVTDLMDFYEIVSVTYFTDLEKARVFVSNWKSALNNLDPSTKNLFLYDIKLGYEEWMANHKDLGDPSLFEVYRFDLREDPEETALQARCIKCDIVQNLSYKTSNLTIRSLNNKPLDIKCPSCGADNCLVVSIFTNSYNTL
jgi:hypothetical protein